MLIDCDACAARGPACGDCVVMVLLGAPPARRQGDGDTGIDLDRDEQAALAVLAGSGLVPPLRLVAADDSEPCVRHADPSGGGSSRHASQPKQDGRPGRSRDLPAVGERAGERGNRRPGEQSGGDRRTAV